MFWRSLILLSFLTFTACFAQTHFLGKPYKFHSSVNLGEFLGAVGVPSPLREIALSQHPVVTLTWDEKSGYYVLKTETDLVGTTTVRFKLGEEFVETTPDFRRIRSIISLEGNTMTQSSKVLDGGKNFTIVYEFKDQEVTAVATVGDIKSTLNYKLVE